MLVLKRLWRLGVMLGLLSLAVGSALFASGQLRSHGRLAHEVTGLSQQQSLLEQKYARTVSEGQRLQTDSTAQVDLLKQRMGYAQPNEIPIVVQIDEPVDARH